MSRISCLPFNQHQNLNESGMETHDASLSI
jgi:hypothetical protein